MAEHGEVVAGAMATAVAFLGALGAALKFWPKQDDKSETPMDVLTQRVNDIERRQHEMDMRIDKVFDLLGDVNTALSAAQADIREALTTLRERRK